MHQKEKTTTNVNVPAHLALHGFKKLPQRLNTARADDGYEEPVYSEHEGNALDQRKREGELSDLSRIVQVDDSSRVLLEDPGKNRRRHRHHTVVVLHNEPLDPLQDNLNLVVHIVQELETLRIHTHRLDDLERLGHHLRRGRNLLQRRAVQETHKSD